MLLDTVGVTDILDETEAVNETDEVAIVQLQPAINNTSSVLLQVRQKLWVINISEILIGKHTRHIAGRTSRYSL